MYNQTQLFFVTENSYCFEVQLSVGLLAGFDGPASNFLFFRFSVLSYLSALAVFRASSMFCLALVAFAFLSSL